MPNIIIIVFLKPEEYFGGVFGVDLYFGLEHIVTHFQLFIGDLINDPNNSIGEYHIGAPGGYFIDDFHVRPEGSGIESTLYQLFDSWIQPDGTDGDLCTAIACNIVTLNI